MPNIRIGHGYDVHQFAENRPLILAGVTIPYTKGLLGHSDADIVAHVVMDAILGALALGDIGAHFPDTDPAYKGADSMKLLQHCISLAKEQEYSLGNLDITIVAQAPKLAPYMVSMKTNLVQMFDCQQSQINIKATTEESLGFTGQKLGMAAHAVCLMEKQ